MSQSKLRVFEEIVRFCNAVYGIDDDDDVRFNEIRESVAVLTNDVVSIKDKDDKNTHDDVETYMTNFYVDKIEVRRRAAENDIARVVKRLLSSTPKKRKRESVSEQKLRVAVKRGRKSRELGAASSLPGVLLVRDVGVVHGKGVIADHCFEEGDPIIACTGEIRIESDLSDVKYDEKLCYSLDKAGRAYQGLNIDTGSSVGNLVCYVNSAKSLPSSLSSPSHAPPPLRQNAEICFDDHAPLPVLYATKKIKKGQEILAGYDVLPE